MRVVQPKEWVVGSLDVEALYPSLDVDECAKVVGETLYNSKITVEHLQWKDIALYLKYNATEEQLRRYKVKSFLPKRKTTRGHPPTFTGSGCKNRKEIRFKSWTYRKKPPNKEGVWKMFCLAIEILIKKTMELHDFVFDNTLMRQREGGSIGLSLTGDVAKIYMSNWDKIFKEKLRVLGIILLIHKRFVDDINILAEDTMTINAPDKGVMTIIQSEANSIHPSIKTTIDFGSKYADGKLPMLDVKLWIGKNKNGEYKLFHEHYMKDVSSRSLIHAVSAHPEDMKKNILINEVHRILRNCSSELEWEDIVPHLNYFVKRMIFSGYDTCMRYKVMKKAIDLYKKKERIRAENNSNRFIPSREVRKERFKKKREKKSSWSMKEGSHETIMFTEMTEDSELKNRIQIAAKRNKIKIKVQERP